MSHSSQRPSEPDYYIKDCRIFGLCTLHQTSCQYHLINYFMPEVGNGNVGAKSTTGNLLGLNTNPMGVTDNPNYSPSTSQQQNRTTTSPTASTTASTVPPVNIISENTG